MIQDFPTIAVNTFGTILFSISNLLYICHAYDATLAERKLLGCAAIVYIFLLSVNLKIIRDLWVVPFASVLMVLMSCSPFFDYLGAKCNAIFHRGSKEIISCTPGDGHSPAPIYLSTSEQSSTIQMTKHRHEHNDHLPPVILFQTDSLDPHDNSFPLHQHTPLYCTGENWSSHATSQTLSIISCGGSFSWMLYGLCIGDLHIVVPNALSTLLSILQLVFLVKPGWAPQSPLFSRSFI